MHSIFKSAIVTLLALGASNVTSKAQFLSDFNSGLPPGSAVYGNAIVDTADGVTGGCLKLTTAANSLQGTFIISDLSPGSPVNQFKATFKLLVGGGTTPPADGFSFNLANDLPQTFSEEGEGSGLTICLDNYVNGDVGETTPTCDIKWNRTVVATVAIPTMNDMNWHDVVVNLDADGTVDVSFDGNLLHNNVATPYTPISGGSFGFGARTGGANANHWVDNLSISLAPPVPPAGPPIPLLVTDFTSDDGGFTVANNAEPYTNIVSDPLGPWTYNAGAGNWTSFGPTDCQEVSSSSLRSPTLTVSTEGMVVLAFTHRYSFEADTTMWDGGQVRYSVNGGPYSGMIESYNTVSNGYSGIVQGDGVLKDQAGFVGTSTDYAGNTYVTSAFKLGMFPAGATISVGFIGCWDQCSQATAPNWDLTAVSVVVDTNLYPPILQTVDSGGNPNGITLTFSKSVDPASATNPLNYIVGGRLVSGAAMGATADTVVLTVTPAMVFGTTYAVTVTGVIDQETPANTIFPDPTVVNFTHGQGYTRKAITRNRYLNIGGGVLVPDLLAAATFPNSPDQVVYPSLFEDLVDVDDNMGTWMYGTLIAPVTGDYTFYIATDDAGSLLLSTDANPANATEIAFVSGWAGSRLYKSNASQTSEPQHLIAGQEYYLEAFMKEGGGGNNLSAAWEYPGSAVVANNSSPISAAFFKPFGYIAPDGTPFVNMGSVVVATQPQSVTAYEQTTATFTVVPDGTAPYLIQWYKNGVAIDGATGLSYTTPPVAPSDDQASFTVDVANAFSSTTSEAAVLTVTTDVDGPTITAVRADAGFLQVLVFFNETVTAATATEAGNYALPGYTLSNPVLAADGKSVTLTLDAPLAAGESYTLTVNGVQDTSAANNQIAADSQQSFTGWQTYPGQVLFERYNIGTGTAVALLTSSPQFPYAPDEVRFLSSFSTPVNMADGFGARLSGYFTPPQDGNYIFFAAGDDDYQVFLSTDDNPANKQLIIAGVSCCQPLEANTSTNAYPNFGLAERAPIALSASQKYYIEALYKEGNGGDYLTVAYGLDTDLMPPTNGIPAQYLSTAASPDAAGFLTILQQPASGNNGENSSARLSVVVSNQPNYRVTYQWQQDDGTGTFTNITGATSAKFVSARLALPPEQYQFRCIVTVPGITVTSDVAVISMYVDEEAPTLASAFTVDGYRVGLTFSEAMEPELAADYANYMVTDMDGNPFPDNWVETATLNEDGNFVLLSLNSAVTGDFKIQPMDYALYDLVGNPLADGSSIQVDHSLTLGNVGNPDPTGVTNTVITGNREFTVTTGGSDLWEAPQDFTFIYEQRTGDFDVVTRVDRIDYVGGDSTWAKAGLTARESLAPEARMVLMVASPAAGANTFESFIKETPGGSSMAANVTLQPVAFPNLLRIKRVGTTFTTFRSTDDGATWTVHLLKRNAPMFPDTLVLGLATCSHIQGTATTGEFKGYWNFAGYPAAEIAVTQSPASGTFFAGTNSVLTAQGTVTGAPANEIVYQWQMNTVDGWADIRGAHGTSYTTPILRVGTHEYRAVINVPGVADVATDAAVLTVDPLESDPPLLVSAVGDATLGKVVLTFNENVDTINGANIANYQITGGAAGLTVLSASVSGTKVTLMTSAQEQQVAYTVTVNNVTDLSANPIAADSTVNYTGWVFSEGYALVQIYTGIGGGGIGNLTGNAKYPNSPAISYYTNRIEGFQDWKDDYGTRISGYIVPPLSGDYMFGIASDDDSRFLLSTDSNPANLVEICGISGWSPARTYNSQSGLINLSAGQKYYYEARHAEGGGGDNLAVAWQKPGDPAISTGQEPVQGFVLGVYANPDIAGDITIVSQPQSEITVDENAVLNLTVAANNTLGRPQTYQWYANGAAIAGANSATYVTPQLTLAYDQINYQVVIGILGKKAASAGSTITVVADEVPPGLVSVVSEPYNHLVVQFTEVVQGSAGVGSGDWANYMLDPWVQVNSATPLPDGKTVILETQPLDMGTTYTLTAMGIQDIAGNFVDDSPDNMATFTTLVVNSGVLRRQWYYNLSGGNVFATLTNNAKFPNNADKIDYIPAFNSAQTSPDIGNYGLKISGYVTPTISGNYTFQMDADDSSLFSISTDMSRTNLRRIMTRENACCSAIANGPAVTLVAGRTYYVEGLMQEGGGGDFFYVKWMVPGGTTYEDFPSSTVSYAVHPDGVVINITQQPASRAEFENRNVTFQIAAVNPLGDPITYQWQKNGVDIDGATGSSYTTPLIAMADNMAVYRCVISTFGKSATSAGATLLVIEDTTAPKVLSVVGNPTLTQFTVTFDELIDSTSANDPANYAITGGPAPVAVLAAQLNADGKSVLLTTDPQAEGILYTITVNSVLDLKLIPVELDSAVSCYSFAFSPGFVRFDVYNTPEQGTLVSMLTGSPNYPDNPRETYLIRAFNTRQAYADDSHEQFGGRISGYVVPPVSGNYIFYIRSDDASELWLNVAGTMTKIVEELGCCNAFSARASAPIALVANQRYYIEALYKEGGGGDHCAVSAKLASDSASPDNDSMILKGALMGVMVDPTGTAVAISQQPANASVELGATVNFSVAAGGTNAAYSDTRLAYQWEADDGLGNFSIVPFATDASLSIPANATYNGISFRCQVFALGGATETSTAAKLIVNQDVKAPTLVSAQRTANKLGVVVVFSEPITSATANQPLNYGINNGVIVLGAALGADNKTVTLATFEAIPDGTDYILTVNNIKDTLGNTIAANSQIPVMLTQYILQTTDVLTGFPGSEGAQPGWPTAENPQKLVDGLTSTKFLNFGKLDCGFSVTPIVGPSIVTGIILSTANDAPERDPASYILYGSNDGGANYTEIASGACLTTDPGRTVTTAPIMFANTTQYTNYKLVFPTVRNAAAANSMQISEVQFIRPGIHGPLHITVQPQSQNVLAGANVTFNVTAESTSGTLAYQWQKGGVNINGATSASLDLAGVSLADAGAYSVIVSDGVNTPIASQAAKLVVIQPPVIVTQPASATVLNGQLASFAVAATGANLTYQWYKDGVEIPGAIGSMMSVRNCGASDRAVYTVAVSNGAGSTISSGATLTVNIRPTITVQPVSQTVDPAADVTFTVAATGDAPLTYQWSKGGVALVGETGTSLVLTGVQNTNEGAYTVTVTNAFGTATSVGATLTVNDPPTITTEPVDQFVLAGGTATFTVAATGTAPLAFQWVKDDTNVIADATGTTLTVTNVQAADLGNYSVVVTNHLGAAISVNAVLGFVTAPNIGTGTLAKTGDSFSFGLPTQAGVTYTILYAEDVNGPWLQLGAPVVGDGSVLTVSDANAVTTHRFYRVVVQ